MTSIRNDTVRILVIDNDGDTRDEIAKVLTEEGFNCIIAADMASAMRMVKHRIPSLVISNLEVDRLDAGRINAAIRALHPGTEIPFMFISDSHQVDLPRKSRDAGGSFFLSKPFDPSVLIEIVNKALWMPHLVRRHVDVASHTPAAKGPKVLGARTQKTK